MCCCVQKHLNFLNLLSKTRPTQQRAVLETTEPDQISAMCESAYNIMHAHGNISLPQRLKTELIPKKQGLRDLADTKVPYKGKKNLQLQSGGSMLGALLPPAIRVILGFINNSRNTDLFNGSDYEQSLLHLFENIVPEAVYDAEIILHTMISCRGIIRWDGRRRLIVDRHTLPGTDFVELLEYAVLPYFKNILERRN